VAEECVRHLERMQITHSGSACGVVTMSVGVATVLPTPESTVEELIASADRALYAAKHGGRNRAVSSENLTA
jgi:two-component system chemotaxis family response regulator WspR